MSGEGSGRRPTDEQKYKDNYDEIFGKKKKEKDDNKSNCTS